MQVEKTRRIVNKKDKNEELSDDDAAMNVKKRTRAVMQRGKIPQFGECICAVGLAVPLHDVVLGQTTVVGVHGITAALLKVANIAESKLTTTVLVALELGNGRIGSLGGVETNDTSTARAATWLVLDLSLLDLSNRTKEFDQVFVAGRPRKLYQVSVWRGQYQDECGLESPGTYVSNVDGLAPLAVSGREVSERVRWNRSGLVAAKAASSGAATAAAAATTAAVATSSAAVAAAKSTTTTAKATAATEAATEASSSSEATATAEATSHSGVGEAVHTNLEDTALPIVAVELLDRIAGIIGGFEDNNAGALRSTIGSEVDVGANNTSGPSFPQQLVSIDSQVSSRVRVASLPACLNRSFRSCQPTV